MAKTDFFVFLALFGAYIGQPDSHIGWVTLMPFASINPTNPRTNLWNFGDNCSVFAGGWKTRFFWVGYLKNNKKYWWHVNKITDLHIFSCQVFSDISLSNFFIMVHLLRVYKAVQLLSATIANAIDDIFKEGSDGDLKHFKELAEFIRLADQ